MDAQLIVAVALCGLVGVSLGAFGGGGSILTVPVLVYVARLPPAQAVGTSLAVVGIASATAAWAHHGRGRLRAKIGLLFGASSALTAYLGAGLTHLVSGRVLMLLFAALMVVVGAVMLFGKSRDPAARKALSGAAAKPTRVVVAGAAVGVLTGFLGVGGGFLIVPALVAFAALELEEAVGTSLLVIAATSAAGFLGHFASDHIDVRLAAYFTLAAVSGAVIGTRAAHGVSPQRLRTGFAVFVSSVGVSVAIASWLRVASPH